jgi:hypothetical protein
MTSLVQPSGPGSGSATPGPSSNVRKDPPSTTEETPLLGESSSSSSLRSSTQKDSNSRHVEDAQSKVQIPLARGVAIGLSLWLLIFLTGTRTFVPDVVFLALIAIMLTRS